MDADQTEPHELAADLYLEPPYTADLTGAQGGDQNRLDGNMILGNWPSCLNNFSVGRRCPP